MLILEDILSQEIIQKLGWTLLHFVWQVAVIALLLAILLRLLRKSAANLRYIIACLALVLIVLLPVITIQLVPVSVPQSAGHIEPAPAPTVLPTEEIPAAETTIVEEPEQLESVAPISADSWKQRAVELLEPALPYIVSGWLLGVFGLSVWHLGGWAQLQRLRRRMVRQVNDTLHSKLKVLAERLRVKQTVQLMESALVQIPTVVGWLRPMILLPASALTGLTSEQLEAILAHELAHIKRYDYLVNILQTVVEILGFYHPAVWWVSHKIRAERENCCDDLAVSISGDRVCYARALTSMEEIRTGQGQLAVAATGGNLFRRICRLVGKDSADKTSFSWIPAVTVLLLIIALLIPTALALTAKSNPQQAEPKTNVPIEDRKTESAVKLKQLGLAVAMYADEHDDNLPDSLRGLKPYIRDEQDFNWLLDNIKYFGSGKSAQRNAALIPIAYDRELLEEADGTNVLSLDFSVRFLDTKEFEKLDIKRAEFLIEARFLSVSEDFLQNIGLNADSPDKAQALLRLKSELLAASDGSKTQSLILDERNVSLLLEAVRANKDAIVLALPQVLCREDKTAEIRVFNNEIHFISGYTEPNRPSEKPEPKYDSVKEGIFLSLKPKLTTKKNVDLEFELEITQVPVFEERQYKGKYPYKHLTVQKTTQATRYIAHNGQTLLCWGHKISKQQEGRTEQKDLLVLIKAQTVDSSEQDKLAKTENLIVTEPPRTTSGVIIPPVAVQSRTERRKDNEQEKTKSATEQKPQTVQKLFKLKHHSSSQMAQILRPLLSHTGHISADERTNSLLVIDTAENLMRIEKIIAQFDVSKVGQTVTEIFEIRYANPVEIVELLKKLINGPPGFGSIIEPGKEPIVLVPEPRRKWIIAKASPENIKQIGEWIKKLDISKSIGMDSADAAAYEQLETIVDLSDLNPGMSFGEVIEMLKNSVEPPLQIQPIWKDLLENAEVEQTTPAGMDPLTRIKLRKALEILIASVTSSQLGEFGELTYIVDDGVILIGTVHMLHPRMVHRVYDISDLIENAADADALIRRITETIEPDSWYKLSNKGEGTIMAYPALQPKKFAVMQTYKIHQQITRFLEDTRSSRDELRKTKPEIMIETVFLSVSEDYLKDVGLDANTANFSDGWTRHLAAKYPAGPNGQPYGLIIDDLHVRFLLRTVQAHHDSKALVAPRVLTRAGTTAEIGITTEEYNYISGYNEPQDPSVKPQQKLDKVEIGTHIWLTPKLTDNNKNVNLAFKLEITQLEGIIEGKYKGKYPYYKPIVDVISAKMPCTIPDGKIMLIGGLKINEQIKKEPGTGQMRKLLKEPSALQLKDLPLIGAAFSSKDKIKDHKMLLILVKPIINPQQKASKILRGQADSEELIKHLGRQLEKKLKRSAEQRRKDKK